jgi:WD40 repeat protein
MLELASRIAAVAGVSAAALDAELRDDPSQVAAAIRRALVAHARRRDEFGAADSAPAAVRGSEFDGQTPHVTDTAASGGLRAPWRMALSPRLVLIVDQFEEVFTQCDDAQERQAFISTLCTAAGATAESGPASRTYSTVFKPPAAPAIVVIGIRADFYARCAAYTQLAPYLQDNQVLVGSMDQAGLRAAIERPAALDGLAVEAGLVELMLTDLGCSPPPATPQLAAGEPDEPVVPTIGSYEAGRLPLLAYALQQAWACRDGGRLTLAGYRSIGGIDGAVARAAESVYDKLDDDGKQAVRRMLLRLVNLGDGTADTRRQATAAELIGTAEPAGSADSAQVTTARAVLADLIEARLLTADTDGAVTIQISHEALLSAWPRLREWLNQDRAGQRIRRDLTHAAKAWRAQTRETGHLFTGTRLVAASEWAASHDEDLNSDERAFIAACWQYERRSTRRRRAVMAALAVLTLISVVTAALAVRSNRQAVSERNQAISNQIAAEAQQLQNSDPSLAAQLDLVAYRLDPTPDNTSWLLDTANIALAKPLEVRTDRSEITSVAFSPQGRTLAAAAAGGTIWLWDLYDPAQPTETKLTIHSTGSKLDISRSTSFVAALAFSPDGHILAAANQAGMIWLWNLTDTASPSQIGQPLSFPVGRDGGLPSLAFSPDGHTLAISTNIGATWLMNLTNLGHLAVARRLASSLTLPASLTGFFPSVAFSPDGRILATINGNGTVSLWNVTSPARATEIGKPLTASPSRILSVAFSPDGHTLATGAYDGTTWLWNVTNQANPARIGNPLTGPTKGVSSVAFSPDGNTLAAGSYDDTTWLWNVTDSADPTPLGQLINGSSDSFSGITSVAFSPDGHTLATGDFDGTVWLWSLPSTVLTGLTSVESVALSPDGKILAAGSDDGTTLLWNMTNPDRPTRIGGHLTITGRDVGSTDQAPFVAFSPDMRILATGNGDGTVSLRNVINPARPDTVGRPLIGSPYGSNAVAFSPNGHIIALGNKDGTVSLWNVTNPARPTMLGQSAAPLPARSAISAHWHSARTGTPWPPGTTTARSGYGT